MLVYLIYAVSNPPSCNELWKQFEHFSNIIQNSNKVAFTFEGRHYATNSVKAKPADETAKYFFYNGQMIIAEENSLYLMTKDYSIEVLEDFQTIMVNKMSKKNEKKGFLDYVKEINSKIPNLNCDVKTVNNKVTFTVLCDYKMFNKLIYVFDEKSNHLIEIEFYYKKELSNQYGYMSNYRLIYTSANEVNESSFQLNNYISLNKGRFIGNNRYKDYEIVQAK